MNTLITAVDFVLMKSSSPSALIFIIYILLHHIFFILLSDNRLKLFEITKKSAHTAQKFRTSS